MATQVDVCNMALAHLGVVEGISNIQTDRTPQGIYLRLFYSNVLGQILGDAPWPFATKVAALGLVGASGASGIASPNIWAQPSLAPTPFGTNPDATEWGYTYAYPSDCKQFRRILSGDRNDVRWTRVPYRIFQVNNVVMISTDMPNAVGEYTADIEDLNLVSDEFVMALSYSLASAIAPGLTKGDPLKLGAQAMQMYRLMISKAQSSAWNEEQSDLEPQSEFIRGR